MAKVFNWQLGRDMEHAFCPRDANTRSEEGRAGLVVAVAVHATETETQGDVRTLTPGFILDPPWKFRMAPCTSRQSSAPGGGCGSVGQRHLLVQRRYHAVAGRHPLGHLVRIRRLWYGLLGTILRRSIQL